MIPVLENTTDRKGIGLSLRQTGWGGGGEGREVGNAGVNSNTT